MLKKQGKKTIENKDIGISKSSRLKGIGENRNREKMTNRKSEYIELDRNEMSNEGKVVYINLKKKMTFQMILNYLNRFKRRDWMKNKFKYLQGE